MLSTFCTFDFFSVGNPINNYMEGIHHEEIPMGKRKIVDRALDTVHRTFWISRYFFERY